MAKALDDPGGTVGRAVVGGAMSGVGLVLGGAWKLGEMATKKAYESTVTAMEKTPDSKEATNESPPSMNEQTTIEAMNTKIPETPTEAGGEETTNGASISAPETFDAKQTAATMSTTNNYLDTMNVLTEETSVLATGEERSKAPRKRKAPRQGGGKGFGKK